MTTHLESAQDLAVLLGARQADIMRLLWTHGPATVREIHTQLTARTPLAFTTVLTLCVKLTEKGVLERHKGARVRSHARGRPLCTHRARARRSLSAPRLSGILRRYWPSIRVKPRYV